MLEKRFILLAVAGLSLGACQSIVHLGAHKPDGPLSKAEILTCLSKPHWVGNDLAAPQAEPGHYFKPGYNFSIKAPDGSYGYGFEFGFRRPSFGTIPCA